VISLFLLGFQGGDSEKKKEPWYPKKYVYQPMGAASARALSYFKGGNFVSEGVTNARRRKEASLLGNEWGGRNRYISSFLLIME